MIRSQEKISNNNHEVKRLDSQTDKSKGKLFGLEGFKFNFTAKEKAIKQLEQEQQEKEAQISYNNILNELGVKRF